MKTRFRFELLQPGQKELLLKWLEQPHIREWLHGKGLANLLKNLDEFSPEKQSAATGSAMKGPFLSATCLPRRKEKMGSPSIFSSATQPFSERVFPCK